MRILIIFLVFMIPGLACTCANTAPVAACEIFDKTQIVFRGRVIDHNHDSRLGFAQWTLYRFSVEESFKGLAATVKEVFIDPGSFTSCYGGFSTDRDYLIYIGTTRSLPPPYAPTGSQPDTRFAEYYARVKNAPSQDGSIKPMPAAWKDLGALPVFRVGECSPSRLLKENDKDLTYLRSIAAGGIESTGSIEGVAAQSATFSLLLDEFMPVTDARVDVWNDLRSLTTKTDSKGSFAIHPVPPGSYFVRLTKEGFGEAKILREAPEIDVPASGCAVVRASFDTKASVSGTVQRADGKPAAKIRIEIGEVRSDGTIRYLQGDWATSDEAGNFRLRVPSGRIVVGSNIDPFPTPAVPEDPVYVPGTTVVSHARIFTLRPDEQVNGVLFRLPPPLPLAELFVDVLWPDKTPAKGGARAEASSRGRRNAFERAPATTNRVKLPLVPGRTYEISVDWLSDRIGRFVIIEGAGSQSIQFDHQGQVVSLVLKESEPK